jgi:CRISPR-associated protein Cas5d
MSYGIKLYVSGDYACFTRPEMKVERVSYDIITPSAARAVLEAIYWKPQIRWVIDRIHVLKPIQFTNLRRNEISAIIPANAISAAMKAGKGTGQLGIFIDQIDVKGGPKYRQQRATTLLRHVAYVIEAHFEVIDLRFDKSGPEMERHACEGKHLDMFTRRARGGQCFHQPYFGCREFPAAFRLIEADEPLPASELPAEQRQRRLGWMLHDIAFLPATSKHKDSFLTGRGDRVRTEPRFFEAKMENGIVTVPPFAAARA